MTKTSLIFDPELIANLEATGWRAYYDRNWVKMLLTLMKMCRKQFKMPWLSACLGAYYATRASVAWVPQDHNLQTVRHFYTNFYRLAHRYCGQEFDPAQVAHLEVEYSEVHRRLAGHPDKSEFVEVLTNLHAAFFGLSLGQARESAEWRVKAANIVDLITSRTSTNPTGDWLKLEEYLRRCYQSIQIELDKKLSPLAS